MTHRTDEQVEINYCNKCVQMTSHDSKDNCLKCASSPTDERVVSPTIPERVEEFSKGFDATWNSAVAILLRFIKGEISEEERNAQLKVLDDAEKLRLTTALTETDQQARESERDKVKSLLHQLHLCAIGKYEGDALENVKMQIAELQDALSNPPSQV